MGCVRGRVANPRLWHSVSIMSALVVLGANGFLGREILRSEVQRPLKAVVRRLSEPGILQVQGIEWFVADLMVPSALEGIFAPDDVVINAAYMPGATTAANMQLVENLMRAAEKNGVTRIVHCSTAVVVGSSGEDTVTEGTCCEPRTEYERSKLAIEQRLLAAARPGLEVVIMRPTAIVGPHGENLRKLAISLRDGNGLVNYMRACVFGRRPMSLVPVRDVASAAIHLATLPRALPNSVFIVASDDDPDNNFQSVETILETALGLPRHRVPVVAVPKFVLAALLRLRGRSATNLNRRYDSTLLRETGFVPVDSVKDAVTGFALSLSQKSMTSL